MNARLTITAITAFGALLANAQTVREDPQPDPVLEAIQEFKNRDNAGKKNEIVVKLDPIGEPPAAIVVENPEEELVEAIMEPKEAVLVTGTPPEDTDLVKDETAEPDSTDAGMIEEPKPKPQSGLAVRIEKLQTGQGHIDPSKIKLLAPFPAKPLSQPPAGWRLEAPENAPPFTREVELATGSKVTLTIRPHMLVPDSDGANVFTIAEPGYERSLGYQQTDTVGAILANSIRQLEDDSKQLSTAIENLQQLLVSLPKEEIPAPEATPTPNRKR